MGDILSVYSVQMDGILNVYIILFSITGDIDRSRCGLKLGWGKQFESFVGCIDKVSIWFKFI